MTERDVFEQAIIRFGVKNAIQYFHIADVEPPYFNNLLKEEALKAKAQKATDNSSLIQCETCCHEECLSCKNGNNFESI
jgi:hypothetical protein